MGLIIAGKWKNGDRLCKLKDATVRVCVCVKDMALTPLPEESLVKFTLFFLNQNPLHTGGCANTFSFAAIVKISRIALLWSSRNHSTLVLKDKSHILHITAVSKHIVEFIIFPRVFNYFPDQHWLAFISIQYENQLADSWSCIIHHSKRQVCIMYDNDKIIL